VSALQVKPEPPTSPEPEEDVEVNNVEKNVIEEKPVRVKNAVKHVI